MRTVAATIRPSHAATIRIGKPAGSTGFGFQTCEAVSAAARPRAPSQAPQTVNTQRASIGRLTDRRLLDPTFDLDDTNLSPAETTHLLREAVDHHVILIGGRLGTVSARAGEQWIRRAGEPLWTVPLLHLLLF